MSECNYCMLKSIRSRAKKDGLKVTVVSDKSYSLGGSNVYVHPEDVKITGGNHKKYFVAWMMVIPSQCCC